MVWRQNGRSEKGFRTRIFPLRQRSPICETYWWVQMSRNTYYLLDSVRKDCLQGVSGQDLHP
jgi:hypothetical protein